MTGTVPRKFLRAEIGRLDAVPADSGFLVIGELDPREVAAIWPEGPLSAAVPLGPTRPAGEPVRTSAPALCQTILSGGFAPRAIVVDASVLAVFGPLAPGLPSTHPFAVLALRATALDGCVLIGTPAAGDAAKPQDPAGAEPRITTALAALLTVSEDLRRRMDAGDRTGNVVATRRAVNAAVIKGSLAWAALRAELRNRGLRPDWVPPSPSSAPPPYA